MDMNSHTIEMLKDTARRVVPAGGKVWLYGSRARGDAREDSDWDLLILVDTPSVTSSDEDNIAYPFVYEGWKEPTLALKYIHLKIGLRGLLHLIIRMWNVIKY